MTTTVDGVDAFHKLVGDHLGYSEWQPITQDRVNLFAEATDDHQWIHVDPERAKSGPFGVAIAHGYLTLSLAPVLLNKIIRVDNMKFGVNYGCNKVRFPSPFGSAESSFACARTSDPDGTGDVKRTRSMP